MASSSGQDFHQIRGCTEETGQTFGSDLYRQPFAQLLFLGSDAADSLNREACYPGWD